MALEVGSVTVSADGSHSGDGYALALFEGKLAARTKRWAAIGFVPSQSQKVDVLQALALEANEEAATVVPFLNDAIF